MSNRKQTLLFIATFPQEIIDAANEFMSNAEFVQTNEDELDLPDIGMFRVKFQEITNFMLQQEY